MSGTGGGGSRNSGGGGDDDVKWQQVEWSRLSPSNIIEVRRKCRDHRVRSRRLREQKKKEMSIPLYYGLSGKKSENRTHIAVCVNISTVTTIYLAHCDKKAVTMVNVTVIHNLPAERATE